MTLLVQVSIAWLIDFYLAAALLLCFVLTAQRCVKQPARRLSVSWAALLALTVLVLASAIGSWPRISLVPPVASTIQPAAITVTEEITRTPPAVESDVEPAPAVRDKDEPAWAEHVLHRSIQARGHGESRAELAEEDQPGGWQASLVMRLVSLGLFAAGALANIVWLAMGAIQANSLIRTGSVASTEVLAEFEKTVAGARRPPGLAISSRVQNPLAVGLFRPTILLPEGLVREGITPGLQAALAHEWTHIHNRDLWMLAICRVFRPLLFAHPLFWLFQNWIRADQEAVADAAAAETVGPVVYAEALVRWARRTKNRRDVPTAAVLGFGERSSRSQLTRRITMVLDEQLHLDRCASRCWVVTWAILLLVTATGFSCFTVQAADATMPGDDRNHEQAAPLPEHLDRYGDTMPKEAVLRLGTRRLRHRGRPYCVSFSPDGRTMATCGDSENQGVSLWDVGSGRLIRQLALRRSAGALAFSPGGSRCLAAELEGGIHLWNVRTGREDLALKSEGNSVECVAFAPDGSMFATGGDDGFVRVRHAESGEQRYAFHMGERLGTEERDPFAARRPGGPCAVAFSPDGRFLVSGTEGGRVHVMDLVTREVSLRVQQAHEDGLTSIAVTPDGKQLITGGSRRFGELTYVSGRGQKIMETDLPNTEIRFWDIATGRKIREFSYERSLLGWGHISLSADGRRLATSGRNRIVIWDVDPGAILREIPTPAPQDIHGVTISPDGRIVARQRYHSIDLWEVETGKPILRHDESHVASVGRVAYSPDGSQIASGGECGAVHVWDAETGNHTSQHRVMDLSSPTGGEGNWPMRVLYSPDGMTLAVGGELGPAPRRGLVKLIDTTSGELIDELPGPPTGDGRVGQLAFGPDGLFALAVDDDIDVWHMGGNQGAKLVELRPPARPRDIVALAFLDFHTLCEVRSIPPTIRVWNWSGRTTREIDVREHWPERERRLQEISAAVFSPAHRQVMTCGGDKLITWDLETGQAVSSITLGHRSEERRIALSPDGRLLAVVTPSYLNDSTGRQMDGDDTIAIWDLVAGKQVLTLHPENASAVAFAFSPDGRRLVTGMDIGTALVWDTSEAYGD